jgi:3-dehydroquinate dehydratase
MVTAAAAKGVISGLGFEGYLAALDYLAKLGG